MTKIIALTHGHETIISDEDYDMLSLHKWRAHFNDPNVYAQAWIKVQNVWKTISLHSMILPPKLGYDVDHINGDSLDNRRSNLQYLLHKYNTQKRRTPSNNTSGYRGVTFHLATGKWLAQIRSDNKNYHLGVFTDKIEAAKAYDIAARKLLSKYATINFPDAQEYEL